MKQKTYLEILEVLPKYRTRRQLNQLTKIFPGLSLETVGSIFSQEYQKKMKRTHYKHRPQHVQEQYYDQYCSRVANNERHIIINMAERLNLSPCMLARIIIERHLVHTASLQEDGSESNTGGRVAISRLLRKPCEITDPVLAREIHECNVADEHYGPIVDCIKRSIGFEYEKKLKQWCEENKIAYLGEDQMRLRGYDKTPDIKLEVPIAVEGHVINWIESKASFGDDESHAVYLQDQFWSYWNRFGPGLVIYWFGFIDELDIHREKGILLSDHLPDNIVKLDLSLDTSM